jgi:hypothetical protein
MYLPVINRVKLNNNLLVERALPSKGTVSVVAGTQVEPFTKLGISKAVHVEMSIDKSLRLPKHKKEGGYYYEGEKIGTLNLSRVVAPYNGILSRIDDGYMFTQEERDYWLLSGVWGEVVDIVSERSVLINTQTADLSFAACNKLNLSGELVVFPNPTDYLIGEYLENFAKNVSGKIIYVGDFLNESVFNRALELGVAGLLAGGAEKSVMLEAKKRGVFLGLFTGFGQPKVPPGVFDVIKDISSRYVFIHGDEGILRIPVPQKFNQTEIKKTAGKNAFRYVKKGLQVMVLQKPYFGWVAVVDSVSESSIFVKFPEKPETIEVKISNVLSLE